METLKENVTYPKLTVPQICDILGEKKNTVILLHRRPDGDAIGSGVALCMLLKAMGMQAFCVAPDEVPDRLRFLTNGVQESIRAEALPQNVNWERVISVDVASPMQLGDLEANWVQRISLMIDHHEIGTPFAPNLIDPHAAACGELIYDIACEFMRRGTVGDAPLKANEALYCAISSDTGGFRYSNTTPETMIRAAELLRRGIDSADLSHRLYETKPLKMVQAEAMGVSRLHLYEGGRVALIDFPYALAQENAYTGADLETLIDVARCVSGVEVAITVRQSEQLQTFRVSMRSSSDFNVAQVCAGFGGGGHYHAAGCSLTGESIEEIIERVLAEIRPSLY